MSFFSVLAIILFASVANAASVSDSPENSYERSIDAVVRHKEFYTEGKVEASLIAGVMPYDSVINHYMLGGRFTWHFSDHYAWEIGDVQVVFPSVSGFTTGLVSSQNLTNLQTNKLHFMATSNFVLSPFYGKFHLFGRSIVHFDAYAVGGIGLARDDTAMYSVSGGAAVETILRTGFDPVVDIGLGVKFYLNDGMALSVDMRDYVLIAPCYGSTSPKSNYAVYLGISFFIPTFG